MSEKVNGIGLDWKDSPETVMKEVILCMERAGIPVKFHRIDDGESDGSWWALVKDGEEVPSYQEFLGEEE